MALPGTLEALQAFPSAPDHAPKGRYTVHTSEKNRATSQGPDIATTKWFTSPALDNKTIQRLHSIQLFTESKDQGFCDDKANGTWTWFELAIMANEQSIKPRIKDDIELVWTSHKNVLDCSTYTWLEGPLFTKDHDIFRLIEDGNVIAVRLCSRFKKWELTAKNGYLVIELGSPVDREELNFGLVKANVIGAQEALNEINKTVFPDLAQLPSVPKSLFKAEMLSTASANERPLRVLSLDGGGVRGLAALLILKRVMEQACPDKKPCEVFDLIGGTSTGGFIAIMLGRLEMTVDECITSYTRFMEQVFPQGGILQKLPWGFGSLLEVAFSGEKYDSKVLEKVIKQLVQERLGQDPDTVLLQDPKNLDPACKIFVTATASEGPNNHAPVLLRSYTNSLQKPEMPEIKLWEAARATSAAPMYFEALKVKGQTFVDGGLQANNPLGWLWNEVLQVYGPVRGTDCFLSIGTGIGLNKSLPAVTSPIDFTKGLTGIATNSDIVNILFRSLINAFAPRGMAKKYWRFSSGDGLPDWVEENGVGTWRMLATRQENDLGDLDDVRMIDLTRTRVMDYMNEPGFATLLEECANALRASA